MGDNPEVRDKDDDGKVKEALERDWEQTKSDFSGDKKGEELDQDVDDTVRQATGKDPIPPDGVPNPN